MIMKIMIIIIIIIISVPSIDKNHYSTEYSQKTKRNYDNYLLHYTKIMLSFWKKWFLNLLNM